MYNSRNKDKARQYQWYLNSKKEAPPFKVPANKKKIRNWPTVIKRLESLKERHLFSSVEEMKTRLADGHYCYMKFYIDPFYRLLKRNPPLWFKKLFIEALCDVYENWQFYAKQMNVPYYLKVWIFEPNFTQSQIVLAVENRIKWYEELFGIDESKVPFPHEYTADCTQKFSWTFANEIYAVEQEDFSPKAWERFVSENRIWPTNQFQDVEPEKPLFLFHDGNVWVGEKIKN
ncbi:MAG: hypothetical protein AB7I18_02785 [Candidatus Berkiella sp.]